MMRHVLVLAVRSLRGQTIGSFAMFMGFAMAFLIAMSIMLYVWQEFHYDAEGPYASHTYRVVFRESEADDPMRFTLSSAPIAPMLRDSFPEVRHAVRIHKMFRGSPMVRVGDQIYYEQGFFAADPGFFELFPQHFLFGSPDSALTSRDAIVINRSTALKLFGREDAIGETVEVDRGHIFRVVGVVDERMVRSHFRFDYLASFLLLGELPDRKLDQWFHFGLRTYVAIDPQKDDRDLQFRVISAIDDALLRNAVTGEPIYRAGLQALGTIHLNSDLMYEFGPNGSKTSLFILVTIGAVIFLVVYINAIHNGVARLERRQGELVTRRILGGSNRGMVAQHWLENLLLCMGAYLVAVLALPLVSGHFLPVSGSPPSFALVAGLGLFLAAVASTAGLPACIGFLLSLRGGSVTRAATPASQGSMAPYYALVVIQFSIAIVLVIASIVMIRQLQHLRTMKYGMEPEDLMVIPYREQVHKSYSELENALGAHESVEGVFLSSSRPGDMLPLFNYRSVGNVERMIPTVFVSPGFLNTVPLDIRRDSGLPLVQDTLVTFVTNEAAYDLLGRPELGRQRVSYFTVPLVDGVLGAVISDLPFQGDADSSGPVIFWTNPSKFLYVLVYLDDKRREEAVAFVKAAWASVHGGEPLVFRFLSEELNLQYSKERQMELAVRTFAVVAILLSSFGLFSIALVQMQRKQRQAGIRRVMGANSRQLLLELFKEYALLLLLANLLSWPLGWYIMDAWLSTFTHRIDVMPDIFGIAAFISVVAAITAVLFQVLKIVKTRPVEVLRYE